MTYVDGFVLPVPKKNVAAYRKMANEGKKMWMKAGALQYFECMGDDLFPKMPGVKLAQFTKIAKAEPNETVFFSFIIFKSKAHRDAVNKKVMKGMEEWQKKNKKKVQMPFDVKKMAYGGFKAIVEG